MINIKRLNTVVCLLFIILNITYTAYRVVPTSIVALSMFIFMAFIAIMPSGYTTDKKNNFLFLAAVLVYFAVHLTFADTDILTALLFILTISFYLKLKTTRINTTIIASFFITIFTLSILIYYDDLINSFTSFDKLYSFRAFFLNSNTTGSFYSICIAAILLFSKNNKIKILFLTLFIFVAVGTKSRNVLLLILTTISFYQIERTSLRKYSFSLLILLLFMIVFYLAIVEPGNAQSAMSMFGKEHGSAGRSSQVIDAINNLDLKIFGLGCYVPNEFIEARQDYPIHNLYISSVFGMGIIFAILYFIFIHWIYSIVKSKLAKSLLISFSVYFAFEPGTMFSIMMICSLPIILILIKISEERNIVCLENTVIKFNHNNLKQ